MLVLVVSSGKEVFVLWLTVTLSHRAVRRRAAGPETDSEREGREFGPREAVPCQPAALSLSVSRLRVERVVSG